MTPPVAVVVSNEARLRVMAARIIAQSRWPYLSTLLFTLKVVETEDLPTLAVDQGWRMYYNPEFVMQQSPEVLATMVLHEAMHCVLQHGARFGALKQQSQSHNLWNLAGDANINEVLDQAHMPWGEFPPVRFETLEKYGVITAMTTEQSFFAMIKYFEEHPEEAEEGSDCGGVSGGQSRSYEIPRNDGESPAVGSDQQDVIRDRVAQDILKHALEKGIGSMPGGLLRWAQELLQPKIDWQRELAGTFRTSLATVLGRRDYVFTRPSRRQSAMRAGKSEIILPSMRKPAPPTVAVIIDTSGSISSDQVTDFLSEVDGIAKSNGIGQGLFIIPCDAAVGPIQKLKSRGSISELKLTGGGGTDMGVGIQAAAEMRPAPRIVIVLTDGYTPWPEALPTKIETLIICSTVEETIKNCPDYSRTLFLDPAQNK
jgi:predicted metal-dependent peptidase